MSEPFPGLSVVMIVKNGGKYLEQSLHALSAVADEIVLVDTGSKDSSIEIAKANACRVFAFDWCDDFSKAKNYGIEQVRFRWILNVDADEILVGDSVKDLLAEAMLCDSPPAYLVYQDNLTASGATIPHLMLRLFRNDPRIRFTNPVHECISERFFLHWPSLFPGILDIHLEHYGYLPENTQGKFERNLAILREWVRAEPGNIVANYKLGCALLAVGRKEESLFYLGKAFKRLSAESNARTCPFVPTFALNYYHSLVSAGKFEQASSFERMMLRNKV